MSGINNIGKEITGPKTAHKTAHQTEPCGPIFAIGDVHGCNEELLKLLDKLPLTPDSTIVFLGDYIDRGYESRDVVDTIIELRERYHVVTLKGNHEAMLIDFLTDPSSAMAGSFIYNGGANTLACYSDASGKCELPQDHLDFFNNLNVCYETEDYFFVHAGVPELPLNEIDLKELETYMLWVRKPFLESSFNWGKVVIHGHTPVVEPDLAENRINIDTGCVLGNKLTAIALPSREFYSVDRRKELLPPPIPPGGTRNSVRYAGALPVTLYVNEQPIDYETLNFSEGGMFCRDLEVSDRAPLGIGDVVRGEVSGSEEVEAVSFIGQVLRCHEQNARNYYALRIFPAEGDYQ